MSQVMFQKNMTFILWTETEALIKKSFKHKQKIDGCSKWEIVFDIGGFWEVVTYFL